MRIRDWSSDVCSSDLLGRLGEPRYGKRGEQGGGEKECAQQARFGAGGGHDRKTRSRRPRRQPGQRHGELCPICAIGCPGPARRTGRTDRKSVVSGKSVSGRVNLGGRLINKKKK